MPAFERELRTPRLRGEPLASEHEDTLVQLLLDPRVHATLWHWSTPPTCEDVRAALNEAIEHWQRHGFGLWLLREADTGDPVGRGGLQYTDALAGEFAVEVAWTISPALWGRGLATELAQGAVKAGFEQLGLTELVALTLADNHASRRVMEKTGFVYERAIVHVGLEHVVYRRSRC